MFPYLWKEWLGKPIKAESKLVFSKYYEEIA